MGKFLERHQLLKFPQGETHDANSPININETEFVTKNLPTKNISGVDGIFMEETIPIL